jgi:hypothetical protein
VHVAKSVSLTRRCGCNWCAGQEIWLKLVHWSEDVAKLTHWAGGDVAKTDPQDRRRG